MFIILLLLVCVPAFSEGMWMPQQVPQLAAELQQRGLKIDPARLSTLTGDPLGAVISLGGCTASFVSPDGLVITNHHCAYGSIQYNSSAQRDLITNGFLARTRGEELRAAAGSRVFVTTTIEDMTDRVTGNLAAKLADADRARTIERREKQLVDDCEKGGGVRCRVGSFFEGSQYLRITQMEIRDVRLVYAPAAGIGNFGGETDNWMWPRHTGDFAFYRAYVGKDGKPADYSPDNVPYRPAHWLKVATEGVNPGDLVIVAGYPGRTYRYRTAFEVQNAREFTLPAIIRYATDLNRILRELGEGNRDVQIKNATRIRTSDNMLKNYVGTLETMKEGRITAHREQRERELAAWIAADPAHTKKYGQVLSRIRALSEEYSSTRERDLLSAWILRSSPMLAQAQKIYRWSIEKTKKDIDRLTGYRDRDVQTMNEASDRAQRTIHPASDRAGLRYFLTEAGKLPANRRIKAVDEAVSAAGGIDAFLGKLYATKVSELETRKAMYGETRGQLDARRDPMIEFAAALTELELQKEEMDKRMEGAMSRVRPLYLEALREMTGGRLYPDANSTLRLAFGEVKGYEPRDAVSYEPQTTLSGVVAKTTGKGDFVSPQTLLSAASEKRTAGYVDPDLGDVPVNFLSTSDTTGGNSGSPTLNGKGELCGLLFDGTYESLGSDYLPEENTRSIHVDMKYVLWVMDVVDDADHLLKEMGVTSKS
jgi:hypothetical protein